MDRLRKTKNPCRRCFLNPIRCLCGEIPQIEVQTQLALVIHIKELKRTTNTGRLALEALTNSKMWIRGEIDHPLNFSDLLDTAYQPLLFFPSEEAHELTQSFAHSFDKPIRLIVPDGSWRQASKLHYRHRELDGVPRVKISEINTATQHLRAENTPEGMSTLEAIAKAFSILEGAEVGQKLKALYDLKLKRTLEGRGTYLGAEED